MKPYPCLRTEPEGTAWRTPEVALQSRTKGVRRQLTDFKKPEGPLPQDAFRSLPFTEEDAYYAEQEKIDLALMEKARKERFKVERCCINPDCKNQVMDTVAIDNIEIDKCPICGGVWLDPGELEMLMKRAKGSKNGLVRFFYQLAGHYEE